MYVIPSLLNSLNRCDIQVYVKKKRDHQLNCIHSKSYPPLLEYGMHMRTCGLWIYCKLQHHESTQPYTLVLMTLLTPSGSVQYLFCRINIGESKKEKNAFFFINTILKKLYHLMGF